MDRHIHPLTYNNYLSSNKVQKTKLNCNLAVQLLKLPDFSADLYYNTDKVSTQKSEVDNLLTLKDKQDKNQKPVPSTFLAKTTEICNKKLNVTVI